MKRSGARALTTIASSSASRLSRSASCSASVSVTASSSARATATTAVTSGSLSVAWMIDAWRATGPGVRSAGERARCAEHRDAVPGGGRVDDDEVVGGRARRAAVELRELPELAHGEQLAQPGRRGGEEPEQTAAVQQPGGGGRQLVAEVLLHRLLGVDGDVEQAGGELGLGRAVARVRGVEHPGHVRPARDLRDHRAAPAAGGLQTDRRGDRRLAHPALAGHDDEPVGEQTLHLRSRMRVALWRRATPKPPEWVGGRRVAARDRADPVCSRGFLGERSCRVCGACGEVRLV